MPTIAQTSVLDKLPVEELNGSLQTFLEPVAGLLPDVRHVAVLDLLVRGIVTSQSPLVTQIARGASHWDDTIWPTCQRGYRFLGNKRFSYRTLRKGLYRRAQQVARADQPAYVVIAVDPVNFEKPYTEALEGVSTVYKATPPDLKGEKRLTHGYPAITAVAVNLSQPVVSYAQWFSYETEFRSQNWEVYRAFRMSRAVFAGEKRRFVMDAGGDDEKNFAQLQSWGEEFVIRAFHNRRVEIYNERLGRWESELLNDLVTSVPFAFTQTVEFTHARKRRRATIRMGWFQVRLPGSQLALWVLVAHDVEREHDLILLTNVALTSEAVVKQVYEDWRLRGRIEHGYRFEQEQGLDVEDMRVETLERMRRLFMLVLLAAQFVGFIDCAWTQPTVRWLRKLGGKLGLKSDLDGLYVLMRGISAVWQTVSTLRFLTTHPFPRGI
jgi:hypothetical protein